MKPETTSEAQLRALRHVVVSVEPPEAAAQRRARTLDTLRTKQAKLVATREIARTWRRRALIFAAACLVAVCAAAAALQKPSPTKSVAALPARAELRALAGVVTLDREGTDGPEHAPLGRSLALGPNDGVSTTASAQALVAFPSGTAVEVAESTDLRTGARLGSVERVELGLGRVDVRVPKLGPGQQFAVFTRAATVKVHGTKFWVTVTRSAAAEFVTRVGVSEGTVGVERAGQSVELHAGDTWSSAPDAERAEQRLVANTGVEHASRQAERPAGRRAGPPSKQAPARAETQQDSPSTLTAENALLERALAAARAGNDERALRLLDNLLDTYPKSTLAPNAKVERFRALRRLGKTRDAAAQARRYLNEHPDGMADDEARRLADPSQRR